MHKEYYERTQAYRSELTRRFDLAFNAEHMELIHALWLKHLQLSDRLASDARRAQIEADALAAELATYRPTRGEEPPAPRVSGYCYVTVATSPFFCAAKEIRHEVYVAALVAGVGDYIQAHYAPDSKTACGKKTNFPVSERFTSGGWPRLREVCPDCTKLLRLSDDAVSQGLLKLTL